MNGEGALTRVVGVSDRGGLRLGDGTAGGLDLGLRGARELVGGDVDLDVDVTVAEDLHRLLRAHGALGDQVGDGDVATLREETGQIRR